MIALPLSSIGCPSSGLVLAGKMDFLGVAAGLQSRIV